MPTITREYWPISRPIGANHLVQASKQQPLDVFKTSKGCCFEAYVVSCSNFSVRRIEAKTKIPPPTNISGISNRGNVIGYKKPAHWPMQKSQTYWGYSPPKGLGFFYFTEKSALASCALKVVVPLPLYLGINRRGATVRAIPRQSCRWHRIATLLLYHQRFAVLQYSCRCSMFRRVR